VPLSLTQNGLVPVETSPHPLTRWESFTVPPAPELVTRSVRVYCAKVKQGKRDRQRKDCQRFDNCSHSCFSSPMIFVLKHDLLLALRFRASWEGLGGRPRFLPDAVNRQRHSQDSCMWRGACHIEVNWGVRFPLKEGGRLAGVISMAGGQTVFCDGPQYFPTGAKRAN